MPEPVIGLALGSGAARGWSHIGVIEELREAGIRPDVVAGCSIGALVGSAYLTKRLDVLRDWAKGLTWQSIASLMDVSITGGGLIAGELIEKQLAALGIDGNIEDLEKPFATIATDYLTGMEHWHQTGSLRKAVRASIALPGLLTPAKLGDTWFVDGGLVNPVPVSVCRALGANFIIAVNLNGDLLGRKQRPVPRRPDNHGAEMVEHALSVLPAGWRQGTIKAVGEFLKPKPASLGYFDVLANSINIMQDRITRSRLAGEPPNIMITPRLGHLGLFDFDQADQAIEEGRARARYALPEIQRALNYLA